MKFLHISNLEKLTSLPSNLFYDMTNLRVLSLSFNPLLETLPKSLGEAEMLEKLLLWHCEGLRAIDAVPTKNLKLFHLEDNDKIQCLPESLSRSYNLQEVKIKGCKSLKEINLNGNTSIGSFVLSQSPISSLSLFGYQEVRISECKSLKEINLNGNISIRSFYLSESPISSLSLCGCRELKIIELNNLNELQHLNLSGTAITEIPDISLFPSLEQLDLRAVLHLRRAPWHKFDCIPKLFNLDQCDLTDTVIIHPDSHGKINKEKLSSEIVIEVHISVWDSRLFMNLYPQHCTDLLEGGSLQSFYILVASCEKRKEAFSTTSSQTVPFHPFEWISYKDAGLKALTPKLITVEQKQCCRHVEISLTEHYPYGLEGILEITNSLSVKDNTHISSVSDLNPRLPRLVAFQIERCHKIKDLFRATNGQNMCPQLQSLHVAHLHNMTTLFFQKGTHSGKIDFGSLKHLNLSQCPRLESIFPDNVSLPSLEMLNVTSCMSLQTVFYKSGHFDLDADMVNKEPRENNLQSLHTMRLYLLPQLRHIYEDQRVSVLQMPKWKTLFFRGCWGLKQLPLLTGSRDQKVYVDGESKICDTFKARMYKEQLSYYEFKSKPLVTSTKDGIKNKIFLK